MDRGGACPQWRAADQQQRGTRPACPPHLLHGDVSVQGDRAAATSAATSHCRPAWQHLQQQQPVGNQQQQHPEQQQGHQQQQQWQQQQCMCTPPSLLASHAFNLYREFVGAVHWARVLIEQRPDGEHISLFCRPISAAAAGTAAAAARSKKKRHRLPNQRRAAKQQLWSANHSKRGNKATSEQQQQPGSATASCGQQLQQSSSNETAQQQQQPGPSNTVTGSYREAASQPPVTNGQHSKQPPQQPTTRVTRSSKKIRVTLPPEGAGATSKRPRDSNDSIDGAIPQTDGVDDGPPSPWGTVSAQSDPPDSDNNDHHQHSPTPFSSCMAWRIMPCGHWGCKEDLCDNEQMLN